MLEIHYKKYSIKLCVLIACLVLLLINSSVIAIADSSKEPKPLDIVISCLDAFFKGDDFKIRNFLTDNTQVTLASLLVNDSAGYEETRRVLLADHPLAKLADLGIKMDMVIGATGERKALLQLGSKVVGTVTFKEMTKEDFSMVECRVTQNEQQPDNFVFQVILNRSKKKKDKPWQISAFYDIARGGYLDDYFSQESLTTLRIGNNETAIIQVLNTIQNAQARYLIGPGQGRFGTLENLRKSGEIGTDIENGKIKGYLIELIVDNNEKPPTFAAYATPLQYNKTAKKSFVIDENGVIHTSDRRGDRATLNDPVVASPNEEKE